MPMPAHLFPAGDVGGQIVDEDILPGAEVLFVFAQAADDAVFFVVVFFEPEALFLFRFVVAVCGQPGQNAEAETAEVADKLGRRRRFWAGRTSSLWRRGLFPTVRDGE